MRPKYSWTRRPQSLAVSETSPRHTELPLGIQLPNVQPTERRCRTFGGAIEPALEDASSDLLVTSYADEAPVPQGHRSGGAAVQWSRVIYKRSRRPVCPRASLSNASSPSS